MIHRVIINKFKRASLRLKAILLLLIMLGGVVVAGVVLGYGQNNNSTGQLIGLNLAQSNYNSSTKVFLDSSGNNNNATSANTAVFTSDYNGKSNSAMVFNGTTDNIPLPTISNPDGITIAGWVKIDSDGYTNTHRMILSQQQATYLSIYNKKVFMSLRLDGAQRFFEGSLTVPADEWHFVAATWRKSDGQYRTYLDNVIDLNAVMTGNSLGAFDTGKVGQWFNGSYPFKGAIAGVKVYNRALSQEELLQLYKESKPKLTVSSLEKGLVGYWPLDGENYNTSTKRVTDKSAFSNHALNTGAILTSDRNGRANGAMSFGNLAGREYLQSAIPVISRNLSLSAWINPTQYPSERGTVILGSASYYLSLAYDGSIQTYWYGRNPSGYHSSGAGTIPLNQWSLVTAVWSNDNVAIYVNGVLMRTVVVDNNPGTATVLAIVGAEGSSRQFKGSMSDVRIYNRSLSADEVTLLFNYNQPKSSASNLNKGLIMDMPLTSKYTKTNTPGSQIMTDLSPYSRDGQNYGGVVSSEGTLLANGGNRIATTLTTPNKEGTISIWYKPIYSSIDPLRNAVLYTSGNSWVNNSFEYALRSCCGTPYDNIIYMTDTTGTNLRFEWDNPSWQANEWVNLTVVYKSRAYIRPYINGVLAQPNSGPNSGDFNFPSTFFVGARAAGQTTAKGTVSNLKIYDRPLSADEVKLLFEKGRGKTGTVINGL